MNLHHTDCMQALRQMSDNQYDIAIVKPPSDISAEYFEQLQRVSRHQVIWGGNYFLDLLGPTRCLLILEKMTGDRLIDTEIAWTNFDRPVLTFTMRYFDEIHPRQYDALYEWILETFAKPTDTILDADEIYARSQRLFT